MSRIIKTFTRLFNATIKRLAVQVPVPVHIRRSGRQFGRYQKKHEAANASDMPCTCTEHHKQDRLHTPSYSVRIHHHTGSSVIRSSDTLLPHQVAIIRPYHRTGNFRCMTYLTRGMMLHPLVDCCKEPIVDEKNTHTRRQAFPIYGVRHRHFQIHEVFHWVDFSLPRSVGSKRDRQRASKGNGTALRAFNITDA